MSSGGAGHSIADALAGFPSSPTTIPVSSSSAMRQRIWHRITHPLSLAMKHSLSLIDSALGFAFAPSPMYPPNPLSAPMPIPPKLVDEVAACTGVSTSEIVPDFKEYRT